MARIIGGIGTSHVPAIGNAIARKQQNDPYWKPFFDGYHHAQEWLDREQPDVAIVFYNDHGLNFFLDKMPTFAIGAAAEYRGADEGWGIPPGAVREGDPKLSWRLIENLVADEFDVTTCQEMLVDHAFSIPLQLCWPDPAKQPKRVIPVSINTVQYPLPSPSRCFKLGQSIGRAVESYEEDIKVVFMGTGGLSHQLDGERAGFINREFDEFCMDHLIDDPQAIAAMSAHDLAEKAGTQGVEFIMWLAMRGALTGRVREAHRNYHIPISNTAAAVQVLQNLPMAPQLRRVG